MSTLNANSKKVLLFLLFFTFISSGQTYAQKKALALVQSFADNLKAYAETGKPSYLKKLNEITPENCLMNDAIAQRIAKEKNQSANTIQPNTYYNGFAIWKINKKEVSLTIDHLHYMDSIDEPGNASYFTEPREVVMGQVNLYSNSFNINSRVMFFIRGNKITKIISTGDTITLAKGIELYSKGDYEGAFKVFRQLANADISDWMAQYYTASMLLEGKGCSHICEFVRRQEAILWLIRGKRKNEKLLQSNHEQYNKNNKPQLSFQDYVWKFGKDLTYNKFPQALRLMVCAWNDADVQYSEFPYIIPEDTKRIMARLRPNYKGLLVVKDKKTNLMGYMNESGQVVIPCKYSAAHPFMENGLAVVYDENHKKGMVNVKGEEVIPIEYDRLGMFFLNDITFAIKDNELLIITKNNEIIGHSSGYSELEAIALDKYVLIRNPKNNNLFDMLDDMGYIIETDIVKCMDDINMLYTVYKSGGKEIYSCYKNWD